MTICSYFGIDASLFAQSGALDAFLDKDVKLFIDPRLLESTRTPELRTSYQRLHTHFEQIIRLLSRSRAKEDAFWRNAAKRFQFNEVAGLCLGYSDKSPEGSGIGKQLQAQLLTTAKTIIDAGIEDPELFELMGLFEENIGADRIGDMIANIIMPDLLAYSIRVFNELEVPRDQTVQHDGTKYMLPTNPFSGYPIILVPKDILNDLPVAHSRWDIDHVVAFNEELRGRLNTLIGAIWRDKPPTKAEYKRFILSNPSILAELIGLYRELSPSEYDFAGDPEGLFVWFQRTIQYVKEYPKQLSLSANPSAEELLALVLQICKEFKQAIEYNGLHTLLYKDQTCQTPKKEEASQKVFFGIANAYCKANDLDISPETNSGRGSVDFKISRGHSIRILVETKLSSNRKLIPGFTKQLTEYQKAEQTEYSVYLLIDVGGCSANRWDTFWNSVRDAKSSRKRVPKVIYVNGKKRPSASQL